MLHIFLLVSDWLSRDCFEKLIKEVIHESECKLLEVDHLERVHLDLAYILDSYLFVRTHILHNFELELNHPSSVFLPFDYSRSYELNLLSLFAFF